MVILPTSPMDECRYPASAMPEYDIALSKAVPVRKRDLESGILSQYHPMTSTKMKAAMYGGAAIACDASGEKDMLLMMVGRKTGRELNETLTLRNMRAVRYDLGSRTVATIS
jgi:hypothetical protein